MTAAHVAICGPSLFARIFISASPLVGLENKQRSISWKRWLFKPRIKGGKLRFPANDLEMFCPAYFARFVSPLPESRLQRWRP
jgi:hypothetical protein